MKTLTILLALISLPAFADQSPTLRVDLDGDGIADLVRIRPAHKEFARLEVKLSKSGETYTFDRLVRSGESAGCYGVQFQSLTKGARSGTFVWTETHGDYEGCAGVLNRSLLIRKGAIGLEVTAIHVDSRSFSAGDPSPFFDLRVDLLAGVAKQRDFDEHSRDRVSSSSTTLESGAVPLVDFERAYYPASVKAAAKKLAFDCGRLQESESCPSPETSND